MHSDALNKTATQVKNLFIARMVSGERGPHSKSGLGDLGLLVKSVHH